jgi:uncharacterized membrane protein
MNKRSRPVLDIALSPLETLLVILAVLGMITVVAITFWAWSALPAIVPTHYGFSGRPNAYGGKGFLLVMPVLSIFLAGLLMLVGRYPHTYNYPWPITKENALRQYHLARLLLRWITLETVWTLCGVQWALILASQTHVAGAMILFAPAMVIALIVTIAFYRRSAARARL